MQTAQNKGSQCSSSQDMKKTPWIIVSKQTLYKYFCAHVFYFSWVKSGVDTLSHKVDVYLISEVFPKGCTILHTNQQSVRVLVISTLTILVLSMFLIIAILDSWSVSLVVLIV